MSTDNQQSETHAHGDVASSSGQGKKSKCGASKREKHTPNVTYGPLITFRVRINLIHVFKFICISHIFCLFVLFMCSYRVLTMVHLLLEDKGCIILPSSPPVN